MPFPRVFWALATLLTASAPAPSEVMVSPAEASSYRCGRDVATIVGHGLQTGPLFSEEDLVFTSLVARDGSRLLVVDDGGGIYSVRLGRQGVNRLRFTLPGRGEARRYFMSYAHDDVFRSRLFEFSVGRAPAGRDELDFEPVAAVRTPALLPHFEYAIFATSENALAAITDGRVPRAELNRHRVRDCDHLSGRLARVLKHNLDTLEMIVVGPTPPTVAPARLPASER